MGRLSDSTVNFCEVSAASNDMSYPIVVNNADGQMMKQFADFGISGYPSYILVDPDDRVEHNGVMLLRDASKLRNHKK